jgi:XRE family transcriptional regulator, regulator of sulfur utilization
MLSSSDMKKSATAGRARPAGPTRREGSAEAARAPARPDDPAEAAQRLRRGLPLPPGDDVGAAELARRVAENLRERRKSRGLSLDELAAASGVSRAALSQIETQRSNPSLSVLWKIAVGLGIPFSELLGDAGPTANLLRRTDAQVLRSADGRLESRPMTPAGFSRDLEVYELRLSGRSQHVAEAHGAGTKELIVVLSGLLRMHVGSDKFDLGPGDSLAFPADRPHTYENPGGGEARYHNIVIYGR